MRAGRLTYFLTPLRRELVTDDRSGETRLTWVECAEMRAVRVKYQARAVTHGRETVDTVDAVYYVRFAHPIADGWRIRDRQGVMYDVSVEPNREKGLKLLKCTKVND